MEFVELEFGLNACASAGNTLNVQELTCLQASLHALRVQQSTSEIYFWGKILGSESDYYIAFVISTEEFEFPSKNFFYSGEDFDFKPMQRLTEEVADAIIELGIDDPFTGKPDMALVPQVEDGEDPLAEDPLKAKKVTESDRLAQLVQEIDFDTAAVPKGAYALNEAHTVVPSSDFKGLGIAEAIDIQKYLHFRPPTSIASLRALARDDIKFYSSFLDPLSVDLPKGCWSVRQDAHLALVTLRSLVWPGYVGYHVPGSSKFGGLYFGYAQKNRDLPFIL